MMSQTVIVRSFPKCCRTILLYNAEAIGFGDGDFDDLIAAKPLKKPVTSASLYVDGKLSKSHSQSPKALYERYRALLDRGSVGSFSITKPTIERLRRASKQMRATHIRFHSSNNGIHLALFDLRRFVPEMRLKRKHEVMLVADTISTQDRYQFSITLNVTTFCALPVVDSLVAVDPNGIAKVAYSDGSFYLLRDQKLTPSITTFSTAPLGREIALWLHPKTISPELHTTL